MYTLSWFPLGLENREKRESIFQSGNCDQTGKVREFSQNTGKIRKFDTIEPVMYDTPIIRDPEFRLEFKRKHW